MTSLNAWSRGAESSSTPFNYGNSLEFAVRTLYCAAQLEYSEDRVLSREDFKAILSKLCTKPERIEAFLTQAWPVLGPLQPRPVKLVRPKDAAAALKWLRCLLLASNQEMVDDRAEHSETAIVSFELKNRDERPDLWTISKKLQGNGKVGLSFSRQQPRGSPVQGFPFLHVPWEDMSEALVSVLEVSGRKMPRDKSTPAPTSGSAKRRKKA